MLKFSFEVVYDEFLLFEIHYKLKIGDFFIINIDNGNLSIENLKFMHGRCVCCTLFAVSALAAIAHWSFGCLATKSSGKCLKFKTLKLHRTRASLLLMDFPFAAGTAENVYAITEIRTQNNTHTKKPQRLVYHYYNHH